MMGDGHIDFPAVTRAVLESGYASRNHLNDGSPMQRICFTLQVRPDRLEEYRRRHAAVAPEMLRALAETGWRDYSLFLRSDGLLVGYLVADDFEAAQAALARTGASRRWEESMAGFFVDTSAEDKRPLEEVFHLEDQLSRLDSAPASGG